MSHTGVSDEDSYGGGGGPSAAAAPAGSVGKRKIIKRSKNADTAAGAAQAASHADPNAGLAPPTSVCEAAPKPRDNTGGAVQVVASQQEADALVRRLRQLERENASLANTLAKVCDENANLTGVVSQLENKVTELAHEPLKYTSVLRSLFEPEKTGWFGGSKSAARDQLEKLSEALQNEFMTYKASHASSNDEMQAIMMAMQSSSTNAAEVARVVNGQQQAMSKGPLAVTVHIVSVADGEDGMGEVTGNELREELERQRGRTAELQAQLGKVNEDLRVKCAEVINLQGDLKEYREQARSAAGGAAGVSAAASLKMEIELQKAKDENAKLRDELQQLRQALAAEERLHSIKKAESEELAQRMEAQRGVHRDELTTLRRQLAETLENSQRGCPQCEAMGSELAELRQQMDAAQKELQSAKAQLAQTAAKSDTNSAALQAKLLETQTKVSGLEMELKRTVPQSRFAALEVERNTLAHELELAKDRISTLEEINASKLKVTDSQCSAENAPLNETAVLDTLDKNKERISRLEFERDQLREQLQKAQTYALTRDQEAQRLERAALEDKQRVAFLIKKCASVTADLRAATTSRDALGEELDKHKIELKQLQRQVDNLSAVQKKNDELVKERAQMEARLSSAEELEEKLVKAKETIAYMELAQSRTINISQYAELQAAKEKLENTMGPLKKKLEDANREIERLKSVTDAQQMVTGSQLSSVQNMQDQLSAATANEAKLRDKVAALQAENDRLAKVNASLEANMTDMQDGIKEMAMQMDKERTSATAKAEANSQKQVEELRAQLAKVQAELANVQATTGQFVAEGLYKNVCGERDRLAEENKRRGFEFEKQKSEILIYRQTIADLEAENDEHVKEIESLQDRHQSERASLAERLSAEQRRSAELSTTVDSLKEEAKAKDAKLDQLAASIKDLQELNGKQKRAFEEKCGQEERLNRQVAALQATNVTLQATYEEKLAETRRAASTASPALPAAAAVGANSGSAAASPLPHGVSQSRSDGSADTSGGAAAAAAELAEMQNKLYKVQCENDRLHGELRRVQIKHKTESDEDQRTIQLLQVQVKSRMPADMRAAYEAEINRSAALRNSSEALLKENEQLKKQRAATAAATPAASLGGTTGPSTILPSNAADLQAQLNQLQQQAAMQKSGFDAAMTQAITDAQAKQRRIEELEAELREKERDVSHVQTLNNSFGDEPVDGDTAAAAAAGDDAAPKPKKKVKKVKKKKTLAEQVADVDAFGDVLDPHPEAATPTAPLSGATSPLPARDAADPVRSLQLQLQLSQSDLLKSQKELELLRRENATLKERVAQLTQDVDYAQEDLDHSNAAMDEERADFEKRIRELESTVKRQEDAPPASVMSSRSNSMVPDAPGNRSFNRFSNTQEMEMQLRSARDENEKLRLEIRQVRNDLAKAVSISPTPPDAGVAAGSPPTLSPDLKKVRKLLRQKEAEVQSLAEQLMPTKTKLAEYMAMADRLGLQYPFPPQLEGPTVMRLRAMNVQAAQRATSAPMPAVSSTPGGRAPPRTGPTGASDASPAPRQPPGAHRQNPRGRAPRQALGGGVSNNDVDDLR